jgi:hypothetical protein
MNAPRTAEACHSLDWQKSSFSIQNKRAQGVVIAVLLPAV